MRLDVDVVAEAVVLAVEAEMARAFLVGRAPSPSLSTSSGDLARLPLRSFLLASVIAVRSGTLAGSDY